MWLVAIGNPSGNLPFRLEAGPYIVGRSRGAQIMIAHNSVSRRHARLAQDNGSWTLEDLGSTNGTFVEGYRVPRSEVRIGSCVQFGEVPCLITSDPTFDGDWCEEESTEKVPRLNGHSVTLDMLSATQREIVNLVLRGLSEREIAVQLKKRPHTIHSHLKVIYRRLGVHSRSQLRAKFAGTTTELLRIT
jgi:DNA-binding CsgD family transcriptional regulator